MKEWKDYIIKFQKLCKIHSYDDTVPFIKEMEIFLLKKIQEEPDNIDHHLALASVRLELRYSEEDAIKYIESFLDKYKKPLTNQEKARIYTNIAYYYSESFEPEKEIIMLELAHKQGSEYIQTYYALGLYHFGKRNFDEAKKMFKKVYKASQSPRNIFNYAVALFATKDYEKAQDIFQSLYAKNSEYEGLELALAYCNICLNNRDAAIKILERLDVSVYYFDIAAGFCALGEYEKCLSIFYEDKNLDRSGEDFLYSAFICDKPNFELAVKDKLCELKNNLKEDEEKIISEDYTEEEKQEDIDFSLKELNNFKETINKIKQNIKPTNLLTLCPEWRCYLIDCVRHQQIPTEK